MERILDLLCDAPIGLSTRTPAQSAAALENVKARVALMERLRAQLTPEQEALLDTYNELEEASEEDFTCRKFTYGFCLGASLMLEVFQERQGLLGG